MVEVSTKTKEQIMSGLGHWNGHWDCGTDKEKLQVALFSTKLFTEESEFLMFFFSSISQMKAPDNLWFMALKPSGVLKSRENFFFFSINTCFLPYYIEAGMINVSYCIFFLTPL